MEPRRKTKTVRIGAVKVGGANPISIQSMTKTDTACVAATVKQIKTLEKAGCELVRVAVKNMACARALDKIKARINIPLVADIHFSYELALEAARRGVDGLRLNPGNIYRREEIRQIVQAAKKRKVPIRVGVNAGSLRNAKCKMQNAKLGDLMVQSALNYVKMLEGFGFDEIIVSLKASDVATTVSAYRKMAVLCNYPFHLGITATGLPEDGIVKSALGIGSLLLDGIGDTIRVSLTAEPAEEVKVGRQILQALGLRRFGPEIVACPTCGRCQVDLIKITKRLEKGLSAIRYPLNAKRGLKIAIMGCEVNGPGEAREADIGVACGRGSGLLFKKGKVIGKIRERDFVKKILEHQRS